MKRNMLIIISALVVISAVAAVFIITGTGRPWRGPWNPGRFQLDEAGISEVTGMFTDPGSAAFLPDYCTENRMNCMYYCVNVNPDNEYCREIRNESSRRLIR
jgi:hypothetical protein